MGGANTESVCSNTPTQSVTESPKHLVASIIPISGHDCSFLAPLPSLAGGALPPLRFVGVQEPSLHPPTLSPSPSRAPSAPPRSGNAGVGRARPSYESDRPVIRPRRGRHTCHWRQGTPCTPRSAFIRHRLLRRIWVG